MSTKKLYRSLLIISILLCFAPAVYNISAQKSYTGQLKVINLQADRQGELVRLDMDINVGQTKIGRNEMMIVTPVLKSNSDSTNFNIFTLPPVIVNGSLRHKVVNRQITLQSKNSADKLNPYAIVKRDNRSEQVIKYHYTLPFKSWMNDASLLLAVEYNGCAECSLEDDKILLLAQAIPEEYVPSYQLTYIVPKPESVKERSEKHSASFNYQLNSYELQRNYKNNAAEFNKVDKVIKEIQGNTDLTITDFVIEGYASPEGGFDYNRTLSGKRANSFAEYLESSHNIKRNQMKKIEGLGEDWAGLRKAVEASSLNDKSNIIRVINDVFPPDARDAVLMKLSGGNTYRMLLDQYYPSLRRTDYTIAFNVRNFSVEEARELIKTSPKLLSLNEMYLVAESYPKESKDFRQVFDIAARLYPNDPIAIINSSATDLEGGNSTAALERLEKVKDDPRSWNNIGVAYAKAGELKKAKEYLQKAAEGGDNRASANLEELEKQRDQK
ncbi:MAG: DUF3868 domain-containing protein [Proteiniphilum sp.]|nr:DUF3868 domain-containing protein [Proteiniphilum sp.]MDD3910230.1 DUF3868 domain-containing protein [Proteiniphilum sp.]MDD4417108.1 DUF3868 domain-containing protein [Proteiniphilum sp.]